MKQAVRVWKTNLPEDVEHIPAGPIVPFGEPILVEPFEEIELVRWTNVSGGTMALVSWRDTLYIVREEDWRRRTIRVFSRGP